MPATKTTTELSSALRISVMRLARRLRQQRGDHAMPLSQLATLGTLDRHGPMTPGELAGHEKVQPPSMTRTVAALEEAGYVERAPHPTDRRQVLVACTDQARDLLREDRRRREAWLSQKLAELTPEERAVLHQAAPILERLGGM
ncbi:MAG TPA: MarR family transcriptional regulator [Motilibacteraceae bacterium]|nr:MarR family transcriptional regulator [Motilibacteraceae bacterium]